MIASSPRYFLYRNEIPGSTRGLTLCLKNIAITLFRRHSKRAIRPELLNAHAHDAKHVLLFATMRNCRDLSDQLRSLIIFKEKSESVITAKTTNSKKLRIRDGILDVMDVNMNTTNSYGNLWVCSVHWCINRRLR